MRFAARRQLALGLVAGLLVVIGAGFLHPGPAGSLRQVSSGVVGGVTDGSATLADTLLPAASRLDSAGPTERGGPKARAQGWALPVALTIALAIASERLMRQPVWQPIIGRPRTGALRRAPPLLPIS